MSFQTSEACAGPSYLIFSTDYSYFYSSWRWNLLPTDPEVGSREVHCHSGKVPCLVYSVAAGMSFSCY